LYWIVSELFYPDEVSTAKILTEIASHKSQKQKVSVIAGPIGYELNFGYQKDISNNKIQIYRVKLPRLNKNILYQRIIRLIILSIKLSFQIFLRVKRQDTVLITTNPTFLLLILANIRKIKKFRFELLVHDIYPENLVPAGLLKYHSLWYKSLLGIYNYSYNKADRLIVIGTDMKEVMLKKINKNLNINVIPNWYDNNVKPIHNFDMNNYLKLDVSDKIVLSFAGNLGRVQGILDLIDLFTEAGNEKLVLVIIGDGALKQKVLAKIQKNHLGNIFYLGPKQRSEQNLFLNACNIGTITLSNGMKGLGVPSKTYNLLAVGKPILYIGDKHSEIDNYIMTSKCGWSFSWFEKKAIIQWFQKLDAESMFEINTRGANALEFSKNFKMNEILKLF